MTYAERIRTKLTAELAPTLLEVLDESHEHAGHGSAGPEGETHFRVKVVSESFVGRSRVDRQRLVYALLADEMRERVHALALTTQTPAEAGN
jgi:BolA protein